MKSDDWKSLIFESVASIPHNSLTELALSARNCCQHRRTAPVTRNKKRPERRLRSPVVVRHFGTDGSLVTEIRTPARARLLAKALAFRPEVEERHTLREPSELDRTRMKKSLGVEPDPVGADKGQLGSSGWPPSPISASPPSPCSHDRAWLCQNCSPLGKRVHLEVVRRGLLKGFKPHAKLVLVKQEAMAEYISRFEVSGLLSSPSEADQEKTLPQGKRSLTEERRSPQRLGRRPRSQIEADVKDFLRGCGIE